MDKSCKASVSSDRGSVTDKVVAQRRKAINLPPKLHAGQRTNIDKCQCFELSLASPVFERAQNFQ